MTTDDLPKKLREIADRIEAGELNIEELKDAGYALIVQAEMKEEEEWEADND